MTFAFPLKATASRIHSPYCCTSQSRWRHNKMADGVAMSDPDDINQKHVYILYIMPIFRHFKRNNVLTLALIGYKYNICIKYIQNV